MLRKQRLLRRAAVPVLLALALSLAVDAAAAGPVVVSNGSTMAAFDAGVSPPPADRSGSATFTLGAQIRATDGGRPPALRTLLLDVTRGLTFDFKHTPVCRRAGQPGRKLEFPGCSAAVVGTGMIDLEPDFKARPECCDGKLLVYNGGIIGGKRRLWLRSSVSFPEEAILVNTLDVERRSVGPYRTRLTFSFAGTAADRSLTVLGLRLSKGVVAGCPTGEQHFRLRGLFAGGTRLGGRLSDECHAT